MGIKTNLHKDTVKRIVEDELHFKKVNLKSIPHELTEDLKRKRIEISEKLFKILIDVPEKEKRNILTMDESWIFFDNPPTSKFISDDEERPKKVKKSIGSQKILLIVIWSTCAIEFIDFLPRKKKFNRDYFSEKLLPELFTKIKKRRPKRGTNGIMLHLDNARPHLVEDKLKEMGIIRLPHPPSSPDLAPSDFFLFGYLKEKLEGKNFVNEEDLKKETISIMKNIEKETLKKVFNEWIKRLNQCIENKGDYL